MLQRTVQSFYYGPTGIDKVTRVQGGIQNLSIELSKEFLIWGKINRKGRKTC
jgi:hypothetical protein